MKRAPQKKMAIQIESCSFDLLEAKEEALRPVHILLECLTSLKKEQLKSESPALVPYEGLAEVQPYCEVQKKVNRGFLLKKKNYAGFRRLNQLKKAAISMYLNTRVER